MIEDRRNPPILQETVVYGSGTLLSQTISAFRGLLVAGLLGRESYGLWKSIQVGLDWLGYTHFGVLHGMARRIPVYRERGEREKDGQARLHGFRTAGITSIMAGLLTIAAAWFASPSYWVYWICVAALLPLTQIFRFLHMICLADGRFAVLSAANVTFSLVSFFTMAVSVPFWGIYGVFLGLGAGYGFAILLGWDRGVFHSTSTAESSPTGSLDGRNLTDLVSTGFPIMAADGLFVVWQRIDRVALIALYGAHSGELGDYGLATMVASFALQIPQTLSRILFRRTLAAYSRDETLDGESDFGWKHVILPAVTIAQTTPILLGLGAAVSWWVIRLFLPDYIGAEASIGLLMLASFWCGVGLSVRNVFIATDRQWSLGLIYAIAAVLTWGAVPLLAWLMDSETIGIWAAAAGMLVGSFVFAISSLVQCCLETRQTFRKLAGLLGTVTGPFLPLALWLWLALVWIEPSGVGGVEKGGIELVSCLALNAPMAIWATYRVWRLRNAPV